MAAIQPSHSQSNPSVGNAKGHRGSFASKASLFCLWGFMAVFNDILIPRFREALALAYFQVMLVQFAFR
ncbi:MAG: hypothetical protein ABI600_05820 [Luteolibacter sp.]